MRPSLARFKQFSSQGPSGDLNYYDRLSELFEKAVWATIAWAFFLNAISIDSQAIKNYTFLLLLGAAAFNLFYFRFLYRKERKGKARFYLAETLFPLFIWAFLYLHQEYIPYLLLPYYVLLLATSLTLRRFDSLLALAAAILFTFLETVGIKKPLAMIQIEIGLAQIGSLLIFWWVALKLADFNRFRDDQTKELLDDVNKESEKSTILRKYAQDLILDKEKAAILMTETNLAVVMIDNQKKIQETNPKFKDISDFKSDLLIGKNLDYVLKTDDILDLTQDSYLAENFSGVLTTRRNKRKKIKGRVHFLLGQDGKVKQVLLFLI